MIRKRRPTTHEQIAASTTFGKPDRRNLDLTKASWFEWVFDCPYGPQLSMRWYTEDGQIAIVRSPGAKHEMILYTINITNGTSGALELSYSLLTQGPPCPRCSSRMVPQTHPHKDKLRWGCSRQECNGARKGCNGTDPQELLVVQ